MSADTSSAGSAVGATFWWLLDALGTLFNGIWWCAKVMLAIFGVAAGVLLLVLGAHYLVATDAALRPLRDVWLEGYGAYATVTPVILAQATHAVRVLLLIYFVVGSAFVLACGNRLIAWWRLMQHGLADAS